MPACIHQGNECKYMGTSTSLPAGIAALDGVHSVVINLDKRSDRLRQFLKHNRPYGDYLRVPGVVDKFCPWKGCTQAHMKCVALAKQQLWDSVLILEDDFDFCVSPAHLQSQMHHVLTFHPDFDVVMLAFKHVEPPTPVDDQLQHCTKAVGGAGYWVRHTMYDTLLETFTRSLEKTNKPLDVEWLPLQASHKWLAFTKRLGTQRPSYSDIQRRQVHYKV
jgi:hypothetical protein